MRVFLAVHDVGADEVARREKQLVDPGARSFQDSISELP